MTVQRLPSPSLTPTSQNSGTSEDNGAYSAPGSPTLAPDYTPGTKTPDASDVPASSSYRRTVDDTPAEQAGGWTMARSGTWRT